MAKKNNVTENVNVDVNPNSKDELLSDLADVLNKSNKDVTFFNINFQVVLDLYGSI